MASEKDQLVRLAQYLRRHPAAVNMTADVVSAESGVPIEVVRVALRDTGQNAAPQSKKGTQVRRVLRRSAAELGAFLDREEQNLLWFVALTIIIPFGVMIFGPDLETGLSEPANFVTVLRIFFAAIGAVCVLIIHPILMARFGKMAWVWKAAIVAWLSMWIVPSINILVESRNPAMIFGIFALLFAFAFVALMLAGINAAAVLLSTYIRLKGEERRAAAMTRQELLQRLFEIEEAVNQGGVAGAPPRIFPAWQWANENGMWVFPTLSFILSFANTALVPDPGRFDFSLISIILLFLGMLLTFAHIAGQVAFAFLGGDMVRGLRNSYLYALAWFIAFGLVWLIQEKMGFHFVRELNLTRETLQFQTLWALVLASLIGVFAGLAAFLRDRRKYADRLRQNDPQTLLAELVEIQRRLSPTQGLAIVMVVDAARSSMMKANAQDAQVAEWSFRAYQQFLRDIIETEGGLVHSVAGDGAVALFQDAERAYHAARVVQTNIVDFNQNVNRLRDPFRLRIGLHADIVAGDLNEVQFAAAIDIAAHVEKVSQVGGVAVTRVVAEALPDHRFAELTEMVDDQIVLLSLNPTLDPE